MQREMDAMNKVNTKPTVERASSGVQSAETVLQILSSFVGTESMPMLKTLAERTEMHPAKVHRYLVSLCRSGFVEQDQMTSRYRLGPAALRLAFAAINSVDSIRIARPKMAGFCQRMQETAALAVWNFEGPTIAVKENIPGLMTMAVDEGFRLPLLRSSIGAVFCAWLPRERTQHIIERELTQLSNDPDIDFPKSDEDVQRMFSEVRQRGLSRTRGQFNRGTHSFAAPVFDATGEIAAVLCAIGPAGQFNSEWDSPTADALLACAADLSRALGHTERSF